MIEFLIFTEYDALRYDPPVKRVLFSLILGAVQFAVLAGCNVQTLNSVAGDSALFGNSSGGGSQAFAKVHAILRKNCATCHANNIASDSEADFISEGLVVPKSPNESQLYQRLRGSNAGGGQPEDMPQSGPALSREDLRTIREWIEKLGETPVPTPVPTTPFGKVQRILKLKCVTCHDDFGKYNEADFVQNDYVVPGNADKSELYFKLIGTKVDGVPPPDMPLKGDALTPDEILDMSDWINQMSPTGTPSPSPSSGITTAAAVGQIEQNFEQTIKPLVQRSCMACHDSTAKPEGFLGEIPGISSIENDHIRDGSKVLDFSRIFPSWSVQENDPSFFLSQIKRVITNGSMPIFEFKIFHEFDGQLLSDAENQTIISWADQSLQLLATANPTTHLTASQFFSQRCLGCHNSDNASGGFAFQKNDGRVTIPDGNAKNGTPFITRMNAENSAVYLVLQTDPALRKDLPQMPEGDSATDAERQLIRDWINQGAAL